MARPFGRYGDYVELTQEEIEAMSWAGDEGCGNWRDGAVFYSGALAGEPKFRGVIEKNKWTKINERSRTYHFANGVTTSVDNPTWLWASSTGTHYLKTNSHIHIMKKDWVQIAITE